MDARLTCLLLLLLAAPALAAEPPATDANVRVYRCVASDGSVSLQSTRCDDDHRQQVLDMQRPQDPPAQVVSTAPAATEPAPRNDQREIRVVTVQPPQPMYECIAPDGDRYASDDGIGQPRWVPLWVDGYGGGHPPRPRRGGSVSAHASLGSGEISIQGGRPAGADRPARYPGPAVATGSWVRDTCYPLPQQEVCARLADQRWELIRRYNSALQSERQQLTREQRGIEARMDRDCGGH